MFGIVLKLFIIAVGLLMLAYLAANALRSARRLDDRIARFRKEQEELERANGPINPYAAMAGLHGSDEEESLDR